MHTPKSRDVNFKFYVYIPHCLLYALIGLTLGTIINKCTSMVKRYNIFILLIQILLLIITIYIIHYYICTQFIDDMQGYVAGLFFVAFYFGTQSNIFNFLNNL